MLVFAVETSGSVGSLALRGRDGVASEVLLEDRGRHGDLLGPQARRLLEEHGQDRSEIDGVVVGLGPGSYTGIRIGVSFAKVLARLLDRPLVGLSGLMALAEDARDSARAVAVMEPGHATRIYGAVYDLGGPIPEPQSGPDLFAPRDFLRGLPGGTPVVGNAVAVHCDAITEVGARPLVSPEPLRVRATTLAVLAERWLLAGRPQADPITLEPLYLQQAAAERQVADTPPPESDSPGS